MTDICTTPLAFPSADGASTVRGVLWQASSGSAAEQPRAIVQLIHGMAEHIGRYEAFARFLAEQGFAVCGHDHIGHGGTADAPERLGLMPAKDGADVLVADVQGLRERVAARFPSGTPYFMFGHSMGSLVLRCYLPVHGQGLAGAVICGTAMPPRLVSKAGNLLARAVVALRGADAKSALLHRLADGAYSHAIPDARTPFDWLSRDPEVVDAFAADERAGFMFSAGAYAALTGAAYRAAAPAAFEGVPKGLPVLVMAGDHDPVGDDGRAPERVARRLEQAGVRDVTLVLYPGMRHEVLNEVGREEVWADVLAWLEAHEGSGREGEGSALAAQPAAPADQLATAPAQLSAAPEGGERP